jgi:cellulose synthase/poly-beta-1,6-N-acetylglucosamine synthase-like glycosyltransferase
MTEVDYIHDTWILDEGNDPIVKEICLKYGAMHYSRKNQDKYNTTQGKFTKKTKGGNYNSWFHQFGHKYDIIAQHDVDFIPKKTFLTRTLGYFRDPLVAFVGGPQIYGNTDESWIARGSAEQTYGFYGSMQKGFHGNNMTLLIGANHLIRTAAFVDIDGYTAHIAEDMLTGMKFYANRWKSMYVPETLLVGEGPSTWAAYFGQQMRWSYGCMDIVFRYAPRLLFKMKIQHIINYAFLQQFYFLGIAQTVGIALLTFYFLFGITPANMSLTPILTMYLPLIIFQAYFDIWLQRFNIDPKKEKGFFLRGKLLFIAAWPIFFLAFVGVIRNKHLTYVVTPKGNDQKKSSTPELFIPHLILGTVTFVGMIIGYYTNHFALQMLFWAILNTVFMYGFYFTEKVHSLIDKYSTVHA